MNKEQVPTNKMALIGFVLGLVSVFTFIIGLVPIAAVIFSIIGLIQTSEKRGKEKGQWMAIVGLILGVVYFLVYLYTYGYIK